MEKTVLVNLYVNSRKVTALPATPIALAGSIASTLTLNDEENTSKYAKSVVKGDTLTNPRSVAEQADGERGFVGLK